MLSPEELYILDHDNFVEANPFYWPLYKYFSLINSLTEQDMFVHSVPKYHVTFI
jgi:hypothetical protein